VVEVDRLHDQRRVEERQTNGDEHGDEQAETRRRSGRDERAPRLRALTNGERNIHTTAV